MHANQYCGGTRRPRNLTEELLLASLVSGLTPEGDPIHLLHLFFVANHDLGFKAHRKTYQRVLETGVDEHGYWRNWPARGVKGTGEYAMTKKGHALASREFGGNVTLRYRPAETADCRFRMEGAIGRNRVVITSHASRVNGGGRIPIVAV